MFGLTKQEKEQINELRSELLNASTKWEVRELASKIHEVLNRADHRVASIKRFNNKFSSRNVLKKQQKA